MTNAVLIAGSRCCGQCWGSSEVTTTLQQQHHVRPFLVIAATAVLILCTCIITWITQHQQQHSCSYLGMRIVCRCSWPGPWLCVVQSQLQYPELLLDVAQRRLEHASQNQECTTCHRVMCEPDCIHTFITFLKLTSCFNTLNNAVWAAGWWQVTHLRSDAMYATC